MAGGETAGDGNGGDCDAVDDVDVQTERIAHEIEGLHVAGVLSMREQRGGTADMHKVEEQWRWVT